MKVSGPVQQHDTLYQNSTAWGNTNSYCSCSTSHMCSTNHNAPQTHNRNKVRKGKVIKEHTECQIDVLYTQKMLINSPSIFLTLINEKKHSKTEPLAWQHVQRCGCVETTVLHLSEGQLLLQKARVFCIQDMKVRERQS